MLTTDVPKRNKNLSILTHREAMIIKNLLNSLERF